NKIDRVVHIADAKIRKLGILPEKAGSRIERIQNEARDNIRGGKNAHEVKCSLRLIEEEIKQLKASDSSIKRDNRLDSLGRSRDECISFIKNGFAQSPLARNAGVNPDLDRGAAAEGKLVDWGALTYRNETFIYPTWKGAAADSPVESDEDTTLRVDVVRPEATGPGAGAASGQKVWYRGGGSTPHASRPKP
ncbi:MAG: hypothetical protein ACREPC_13380, partial [Stenotrophomonas sp.]